LPQRINFISQGTTEIRTNITDPYQVINNYGLSVFDVINLCGGIPNEDIADLEIEVISKSPGVLNVQINTNLYQTNRIIDFELRIINNSYMHIFDIQKGIATRLFCTQVREARKREFRIIYTTAMGPEAGADWGGYYCWGRLGYEMDTEDHENLLQLQKEFRRPPTDLHTLMKTEDGRSFWMAYGFTWSAEFHLHDTSKNITYLKEYLKETGKDYEI